MSSSTLAIRRAQLNSQLGENSPETELAILDPDSKTIPFYGVFDDNVIQGNKDSGNVYQKVRKPRFIDSELPYEKSDMQGLDISLPYRSTTTKSRYEIKYIQEDAEGVQILWLV